MAPAYAAMNYLNRAINSKLFVGMRSGLLNDKKGQRTGIPGKYTENTVYATKTFGTTVMLQPELRFDHSWDRPGHNGGKARNQLFFAMDLSTSSNGPGACQSSCIRNQGKGAIASRSSFGVDDCVSDFSPFFLLLVWP
jgi:hypothetical protein